MYYFGCGDQLPEWAEYYLALKDSARSIKGGSIVDWPLTFEISEEDKKLFPDLSHYDYIVMELNEDGTISMMDEIK